MAKTGGMLYIQTNFYQIYKALLTSFSTVAVSSTGIVVDDSSAGDETDDNSGTDDDSDGSDEISALSAELEGVILDSGVEPLDDSGADDESIFSLDGSVGKSTVVVLKAIVLGVVVLSIVVDVLNCLVVNGLTPIYGDWILKIN